MRVVPDLLGRRREEVAGEHGDVGSEPGFDAAAVVLGPVHVGAELGVGGERLLDSQGLLAAEHGAPGGAPRQHGVEVREGSELQTGASLEAAGLRPWLIQVRIGYDAAARSSPKTDT